MAVRFDMSQLIAARAKFAKMQQEKMLEVTQKITLDVGKKLIEGSPVDSGDFRGAWQIDTPTQSGQPGKISNPTVYGPALARGHSSQAPNGWIEAAVESAARSGGSE